MVYRIRGNHKPAMTALRLGIDSKGRLKWFPMHKAINDVRVVGESVVEQLKQLVPIENWNRVWAELQLDEVQMGAQPKESANAV